jgi:RHS repeat-associated protein
MACRRLTYQYFSFLEVIHRKSMPVLKKSCFNGDHLGNIRLSYSDADGNGTIAQSEIIEENNYYPFGLEHKGYNNVIVGTENNHKTYQGQELNEDLGYNMHEYKWRHYDASIGRFNVIDPLATDFPQWAPYVFSGNFVTISKELEGLEPEFMINGANGLSSDNRLTTPMVSLLSAAFGYSPESLQGTTYHRDSDPRSHWFGQKVLKYNSSVIAITVGSQVINRSDLSDRSSRFWFSHIAHEQQHRSDIDTYGGGLFYLSYGLESIRALGVHDNLGHEKSANSNEAYAKQLWDYNGGEVRNILGTNRGGTNAGQGKLLESIGARFRRDVILDDTISGAESSIGTTQGILKGLGNGKEDQGIRAALGNMISAWQQNIKDAKKEQDDITKKYGN